MRRFECVVALIILLISASLLYGVQPSQIAITNVTIVDVEKGELLHDRTVVLTGTRISKLGPSSTIALPHGTLIVDGRGKFLIPGLWDMHTHVVDLASPGSPNVILSLFIAEGVTGIRDMGSSSLDSILQLRAEVANGTRIGPRMVVAGKKIDGAPAVFPPNAIVARTPQEGRRTVDLLQQRRVDFIKVYEMLEPATFRAIVEQAKTHNLAIAGHLPLTVDAAEASDLGMRSFEHMRNIDLGCSKEADTLLAERSAELMKDSHYSDNANPVYNPAEYGRGENIRGTIQASQRPRAINTDDTARCAALIARLARNRTWQCVTLFQQTSALDPNRIERLRTTFRYVPRKVVERWERSHQVLMDEPADKKAQVRRWQEWEANLVGRLAKSGVPLLAGTDESNPFIVPGFGLHEELEAMVMFGHLTPAEALRAATLEPASYLGETAEIGSVAVGKTADLVLLEADPLVDIHNVRKIDAVVANGYYFDRTALDLLLTEAERTANPEQIQQHSSRQ